MKEMEWVKSEKQSDIFEGKNYQWEKKRLLK